MITDIKKAFTSKRTIVAVLTALLIAVNGRGDATQDRGYRVGSYSG